MYDWLVCTVRAIPFKSYVICKPALLSSTIKALCRRVGRREEPAVNLATVNHSAKWVDGFANAIVDVQGGGWSMLVRNHTLYSVGSLMFGQRAFFYLFPKV